MQWLVKVLSMNMSKKGGKGCEIALQSVRVRLVKDYIEVTGSAVKLTRTRDFY